LRILAFWKGYFIYVSQAIKDAIYLFLNRKITMTQNNTQSTATFGALQIKAFREFQLANLFFVAALLMQSTIIGWQVYVLTGDKLALGLIGLSEAVPFILTTFYSGYIADVFSRRKIIVRARIAIFLCSLALLAVTRSAHLLEHTGPFPIYCIIAVVGISRAFIAPAATAFQAQVLPRDLYANGSSWGSLTWNLAAILGPISIGFIYELTSIHIAYMVVVCLMFVAVFFTLRLPEMEVVRKETGNTFFQDLSVGLKFAWRTEAIMGSITLDLLVVLFGSVIALLPAFAKDVLHVGQSGLGFLRAAQFMGSAMIAMVLTAYPPTKYGGRNLLIAVGGFSVCMIAFSFSTNFYLSLGILILSGVFDGVSVVIRSTIIQLFTPDDMRGRVAAVNSIFIKSSNEIGDFESGLAAQCLGLQNAVLFGGLFSLSIVFIVLLFFRKIRNLTI